MSRLNLEEKDLGLRYTFCIMSLPRTFISFSSSDSKYYRTMMMWNANENIDVEFADFQLDEAINSQNPSYIKTVCERKIRRTDTFILLIGSDTWKKTEFVQAEVEVAIEKECRLIGMNINDCRMKDWLCPYFFADKGALFIPFSSRIGAHALKYWRKGTPALGTPDDWYYNDNVYTQLGYQLIGSTAVLPPPPNPFQFGRPFWAK
jgi:hypothetical protein